MSENPSPAPARPALGMDGLSLDQAPPLAIPMTYFLVAPLGLGLLADACGPPGWFQLAKSQIGTGLHCTPCARS